MTQLGGDPTNPTRACESGGGEAIRTDREGADDLPWQTPAVPAGHQLRAPPVLGEEEPGPRGAGASRGLGTGVCSIGSRESSGISGCARPRPCAGKESLPPESGCAAPGPCHRHHRHRDTRKLQSLGGASPKR